MAEGPRTYAFMILESSAVPCEILYISMSDIVGPQAIIADDECTAAALSIAELILAPTAWGKNTWRVNIRLRDVMSAC